MRKSGENAAISRVIIILNPRFFMISRCITTCTDVVFINGIVIGTRVRICVESICLYNIHGYRQDKRSTPIMQES